MPPEVTGLILIGSLFVVLLLGVNVAVGLGLIGLIGVMALRGPAAGLDMAGLLPYTAVANFSFIALPLFILMGQFAFCAGITVDLFDFGQKWTSFLPGGLAIGVVVAGAGFGAACGSSLVSTTAMARISWPELMRRKYDKSLSAGAIASAGLLAVLIPPSILAVVYGMFTQTPIGLVLIAGIIPGLISAALFAGVIIVRASANPALAPRGPKVAWRERWRSLKNVWTMALIVLIVMGGIYGGIFTPTEAAAAGAFGTLVLGLSMRRLTWPEFLDATLSSLKTSAFIFLIIIGAFLFSRLLTLSNLSVLVFQFVGNLDVPRVVILIGVLSLYILMGMILDAISMLAISISTVFPLITGLGYDPIWLGIVLIVMCEIGGVTPPVGLTVFGVKAAIGDLGDQMETWAIFKAASPFLIAQAAVLAVLIMFPQVALFLPSTMQN